MHAHQVWQRCTNHCSGGVHCGNECIQRDRSTIVDESIQYVKNLHHQISVLRQRRSDLKRTVESSSSCWTTGERTAGSTTTAIVSTPIQGNNPCSIDTTTTTLAEEMPVSKGQGQSGDDTAVAASRMPMLVKEDSHIPKKQQSNSHVAATRKNSRSCADKLDVFMDLPEQVVIEMVCQPHPHIQSQILQAVESLGLDVCQCSLNKVVLRVVYVIVAKVLTSRKNHHQFPSHKYASCEAKSRRLSRKHCQCHLPNSSCKLNS